MIRGRLNQSDRVEDSPTTPVVPSPISSSCDFDTFSHDEHMLSHAGEEKTHLDEQFRNLMFNLHLPENGCTIVGYGDITIRGNEDFIESWSTNLFELTILQVPRLNLPRGPNEDFIMFVTCNRARSVLPNGLLRIQPDQLAQPGYGSKSVISSSLKKIRRSQLL